MQDPNGVTSKNVTGLFRDKTTDSEQVTQAIMGQPIHVEREEVGWMWVETWDTYHGWVMSRNVSPDVPHPDVIAEVTSLFTDAFCRLKTSGGYAVAVVNGKPVGEMYTKLVITTRLEVLERRGNLKRVKIPNAIETWARDFEEGQGLVHVRIPDGTEAWVLAGDVRIAPAGEEILPLGPDPAALVATAKRFLGVPYLWGGTSPFGLDCSGFVQLVYKLSGIQLLRDADMQANDPRAIPVEKGRLRAGDLVFFAGGEDKTKITHVGMSCGGAEFIHSAGQGRGVVTNNLSDEPYDRIYWGARRMP